MRPLSKKIINELGNTYGKWTVVSFSHLSPNKSKVAYWKCVCSCGSTGTIVGTTLRQGISKQCKTCHGNKQNHYIKYNNNKGKDLYMIKCGPYIKIGTSSNVTTRLTALRSANPFPIVLVGLWKNMGHLEQTWHEALIPIHHKGEWFKPCTAAGGCEI